MSYAIKLPSELMTLLWRAKEITGIPIAEIVREATCDWISRADKLYFKPVCRASLKDMDENSVHKIAEKIDKGALNSFSTVAR